MEQILVHIYRRVYSLPLVLRYTIPLNVRRKIPLTKTTTNTPEFINESVLPVEKSMGSRGIVELAHAADFMGLKIKLQTVFGDNVKIFIASNNVYSIIDFDRPVRRDPIRHIRYFNYFPRD